MIASRTDARIASVDHGSLGIDGLEMKARMREILNRWPAVGLAVGMVRNGRLEFFYGHGAADITSNTPITEDTGLVFASMSSPVPPSPTATTDSPRSARWSRR
jgi:CubicO group peptidase (beta-lactamase class C family)